MVGMSGAELAEAARRLGSKIPFVLSTGGRRLPTDVARDLGIVAQILKPSIVEDIGDALRLALRP
jgi:CheY-like chemotaxis protein